jgi:hypothetical protein
MKSEFRERRALSWKPNSYRIVASITLILLFFSYIFRWRPWPVQVSRLSAIPGVAAVQQCAIHNLRSDLSFLDRAKPVGADEFVLRRDRLAQALVVNGVDAFVLEPGYTF